MGEEVVEERAQDTTLWCAHVQGENGWCAASHPEVLWPVAEETSIQVHSELPKPRLLSLWIRFGGMTMLNADDRVICWAGSPQKALLLHSLLYISLGLGWWLLISGRWVLLIVEARGWRMWLTPLLAGLCRPWESCRWLCLNQLLFSYWLYAGWIWPHVGPAEWLWPSLVVLDVSAAIWQWKRENKWLKETGRVRSVELSAV